MKYSSSFIDKLLWLRAIYPLFLLVLLGFIWGSGYTIARYATTHGVSFLGYAFWQSLGPALFTTLILLTRRQQSQLFNRAHFCFFALCGLLGIAIPNTNMYFVAAKLPAGLLAVIMNTVALIIYPLALMNRQERFDWLRVAGVISGFCGIMILVWPDQSLSFSSTKIYSLIALLTPFCFALCAIYTAIKQPTNTNSLTLTAGMLITSAVLLTPIVIFTHNFYWFHFPLQAADYCILLEILLSTIGYVLFFELIKTAGPVYYSLINGVVAFTGIFWGKLIFGETLTIHEKISIILIVIGVICVSCKQAARPMHRERE